MNALGIRWTRSRAIVDEAAARHTYVLAHAYTAEAITRAVQCGVRSIEHGNLVDEAAAKLMAERGVYAVPTLVTYEALAAEGERLGLLPESVAKIADVREAGLRSLEIFQRAGVKMGFGTDLLGESHRLQSDEFLIRARVMSHADVLRSATVGGRGDRRHGGAARAAGAGGVRGPAGGRRRPARGPIVPAPARASASRSS